jgi:hypothetical protein
MKKQPPRCAAIVATKWTYQIEWVARCQNRSVTIVDDMPLCGTHINALHRGGVEVIQRMEAEE